jgi:hypothetical protein
LEDDEKRRKEDDAIDHVERTILEFRVRMKRALKE